jgi:peptidoglycan/LPS O-acetylase OafA/YrhL
MKTRVAALDGLRGIAIALVMAYHLFGLRDGWAGVDLFFVLSGFLITTILRSERAEPMFWRVFYIRRITRLIPAYVAFVVAVYLLVPLPWHSIWPYYTFFGANIGYFLFNAQVGPLMALWSLAVEEHFYFVWPVCVRRLRERTLSLLLIGIIACEPLLRIVALHWNPDGRVTYLLTPFRLDGLALGGLLSILLAHDRSRVLVDRISKVSLPVCLAICSYVFGVWNPPRTEHVLFFNAIGYSLISVTSASLVAWLVFQPNSLVSRLLSIAPLRFLGTISYSLYLYHLLLRDLFLDFVHRHGYRHNSRASIIVVPISIAAAWLSFRYYETPFLNMGRRQVALYRSQQNAEPEEVEVQRIMPAA